MMNIDLEWCENHMNAIMTVQTAASLQNLWPASDLAPHMEVPQIEICGLNTVMRKTDMSHMSANKQKKQIWATFICSMNIAFFKVFEHMKHLWDNFVVICKCQYILQTAWEISGYTYSNRLDLVLDALNRWSRVNRHSLRIVWYSVNYFF